ncbi:MAG: hypothetical protein ABI315_13620 [Bacteroidia bacterium]
MYRVILVFLLLKSTFIIAQQDEDTTATKHKKFHFGLYVGSYFANKNTASLYDGYGVDFDGNKNTFYNSFLYNKIVKEYSGINGQPDLIAQALNVNSGDWYFNESDMPVNMKYTPAFLFGVQGRYSMDDVNAILLNINASQLTIAGNFTITTTPLANSNQYAKNIHTFAIKGVEQRLMLQLGYQHLFGNNEKLKFLAEGGLNVTLAKFDKNEVLINSLLIDLTSYYNSSLYNAYVIKRPIGFGFGAFAGLGVNLNLSDVWQIQLLYNPSYEGVNIISNSSLKMQHAVGLRAYHLL